MADAMEDLDELDLDGEASLPRRSSKGLLLGIAGLVAGGAGGWAAHSSASSEPGPAEQGEVSAKTESPESPAAPGPVHELKAFIVNLRGDDADQMHYLKTTLAVQLASETWLAPLQANDVRLRHSILIYLSNLSVADTQGVDNKTQIQEAITERVVGIIGDGSVQHVYLTEFVIQ